MRWTAATTLVLGVAVCAAAADEPVAGAHDAAWDDVPVVKLWKAVKDGTAEASGSRPRSYQQVELRVKNRSDKRIFVDVGGSHLRPNRRGSCQRLGLGPPVVASATIDRGPGTACLALEPGEERSLLMNTCCLDAGRSAPSNHTFTAVPDALPNVREKVLRWWVEHPETPQYAVNSAIWCNRSKVIVGASSTGSTASTGSTDRARSFRQSAAYGGVYFQLKDGELTSLDEDGVRRILGSQIWQVFPTESNVYAVMPGEDHEPDLWSLAPTGENPWGFVTDLPADAELLDVVPAGRGDLALLYGGHVAWFNHEKGAQERVIELETDRYLSARIGAKTGRVYVTVHDPKDKGVTRSGVIEGQSAGRFEVWTIDPETGKAEMADRSWNVSAIRAGVAGIFGLSHKGAIRRFASGKFKDLGPAEGFRALVAVCAERIWVLDESGSLVAVHPTTGRRLITSEAKVDKGTWLHVDPVTGDLAYVEGDGFFVVRGADGSVAQIPERAQTSAESASDGETE